MAGEHLLAFLRGDELGDLRRHEAGELRSLPLDRLHQARIGDRDRGLVGKGPQELDLVVGKGLGGASGRC